MLESVNANYKIGVDPNPKCKSFSKLNRAKIIKQTSDKFFKTDITKNYNLIFIDGLHEGLQVYRDLYNSLNKLAPNGIIYIDDVWPINEFEAKPISKFSTEELLDLDRHIVSWKGDVYSVILFIQQDPKLKEMLKVNIIGEAGNAKCRIQDFTNNNECSTYLINKYDEFIKFLRICNSEKVWAKLDNLWRQ